MELIRLDIILMEQMGFSRTYAQSVIQEGLVKVGGKEMTKPGQKINPSINIEVSAENMKFVSRGGYKLEKALCNFSISVKDKICLDVGASTGGFTDCLLQYGAKKVYAVDTGSSQLSEKLLAHSSVVSLEKTNIIELIASDYELIEIATVDVSFVSLEKIIPNLSSIIIDNGTIIALIKPQFEAGKKFISKKGLVKDNKVYPKIVERIFDCFISYHCIPTCFDFSPVKGQHGNIEFLISAMKDGSVLSNQAKEIFMKNANNKIKEANAIFNV